MLVNVSILDSIMQLFFILLGVIVVYNYVFNEGVEALIQSVLGICVLSLIGTVLDDVTFLFLFGFVMCKEKIQERKFNFTHLNVLLLLITGQILIATLALYMSKWILYIFLNINHMEELSRYSHSYIGIQILLTYIIDFVVLKIVHRIIIKNGFSITAVQSLKIDKRLFIILVTLFGSVELLLLVSDFQGVTAIIQLTLLVTFMLMIGLMGWQMTETISVYVQQKALENEELQNEQLSDYLKNVEHQYIELRKFKHDYKNLIVSLNAQNDMSDIREYLANVTGDEVLDTSLNDVKIAQIQHIKDTPIRGLIIQKFLYAKKCHVELNIEILNESFSTGKNSAVVVRIIGNLLDNAIEQAQKMMDKKVTVIFNFINGTNEISVNNAVGPEFNQHKIFKTGYSTKGDNRGLGLTNVRDLVDRQHGFYLDTDSKSGYVTMTLIIVEAK